MAQIAALGGVIHRRVERNCPAAAHLARAAFLGVEVVVSRRAGDYLALLGDAETLRVRLIGFHIETALCAVGIVCLKSVKTQILGLGLGRSGRYYFRRLRRLRLLRRVAFEGDGEALGAFLDGFGHFVAFGDDREETLQALLKEFEFHILVAAPQEEVHFYAMTFFEPRGRFARLYLHVALGGADFYLRDFRLRHVSLRFDLFVFFLLLVFEFAVVGNFAHRRLRVGGYLDEVEPERLGFRKRLANGENAEILGVGADDAHFRRPDTLIHTRALLFSLRCVLCESHLLRELYSCVTQ